MRSILGFKSVALKRAGVPLAFLGICVLASSARALTVFDFSGASGGPVGAATYAVTQDGVTITAHGYDANNADHNLFWKHAGFDETGLGLVNTLNNELTLTGNGSAIANYIQFDVTQAVNATTSAAIVESVTSGEKFNLYASNSPGSIGSPILIGSSADQTPVSIPGWGTFDFLSVSVTPLGDGHADNNVLPKLLEFDFPPAPGPTIPLPPAVWTGLLMLSIVIGARAWKYSHRRESHPAAL